MVLEADRTIQVNQVEVMVNTNLIDLGEITEAIGLEPQADLEVLEVLEVQVGQVGQVDLDLVGMVCLVNLHNTMLSNNNECYHFDLRSCRSRIRRTRKRRSPSRRTWYSWKARDSRSILSRNTGDARNSGKTWLPRTIYTRNNR